MFYLGFGCQLAYLFCGKVAFDFFGMQGGAVTNQQIGTVAQGDNFGVEVAVAGKYHCFSVFFKTIGDAGKAVRVDGGAGCYCGCCKQPGGWGLFDKKWKFVGGFGNGYDDIIKKIAKTGWAKNIQGFFSLQTRHAQGVDHGGEVADVVGVGVGDKNRVQAVKPQSILLQLP